MQGDIHDRQIDGRTACTWMRLHRRTDWTVYRPPGVHVVQPNFSLTNPTGVETGGQLIRLRILRILRIYPSGLAYP